ncbi:MAG: hypothetical protein JSW11_15640 [Candidatus Heimdallarchaeota archaeon]|nr:MAG: hypothetical protein JSW11_15640 [Candidatus Heimdallarchaeota archaeon]
MKEIINQIRAVTAFCGLEIETITPRKTFVLLDLKSKGRFRKKNFHMGVSKSLNGILAAERELSRQFKENIVILDPVNFLPQPTFDNISLFHDLDSLQEFFNA